jgi:hypothetical protein
MTYPPRPEREYALCLLREMLRNDCVTYLASRSGRAMDGSKRAAAKSKADLIAKANKPMANALRLHPFPAASTPPQHRRCGHSQPALRIGIVLVIVERARSGNV